MNREERLAYMRAWRARQPKKRKPDLDRSKPDSHLCKADPGEYFRRYMRWWRANAKAPKTETPLDDPSGQPRTSVCNRRAPIVVDS